MESNSVNEYPKWKIAFPKKLTEEEVNLKSKYAELKKMKQMLLQHESTKNCTSTEGTENGSEILKKSKFGRTIDKSHKQTSGFKKPSKHYQQTTTERTHPEYSFEDDSEPRSVVVRGTDLSESFLRTHFEEFGFICKIRLNDTHTSSVVTFKNPNSVVSAMESMNDRTIGGIKLFVSVSKRKNTTWCDISSFDSNSVKSADIKQRARSVHLAFKGRLTAKDFESFFENVGRITRMFLNEVKGFGFAMFENKEQAQRAIREMNGEVYNGVRVSVSPQRFLDSGMKSPACDEKPIREEISYSDVDF